MKSKVIRREKGILVMGNVSTAYYSRYWMVGEEGSQRKRHDGSDKCWRFATSGSRS